MTSSGPNTPATVVSTGTGIAWSNPGNASAQDGAVATASGAVSSADTATLQATGFGFAIPDGMGIDGIAVTIRRSGTDSSINTSIMSDTLVSLVQGGVVAGSNEGKLYDGTTANIWPDTLTDANYGGPSDLWGLSWTPSDINASDFGVALVAQLNAAARGVIPTASVDVISATVYYSQPAVNHTLSLGTSAGFSGALTREVTKPLSQSREIVVGFQRGVVKPLHSSAEYQSGTLHRAIAKRLTSGFSVQTALGKTQRLHLSLATTLNYAVTLGIGTGYHQALSTSYAVATALRRRAGKLLGTATDYTTHLTALKVFTVILATSYGYTTRLGKGIGKRLSTHMSLLASLLAKRWPFRGVSGSIWVDAPVTATIQATPLAEGGIWQTVEARAMIQSDDLVHGGVWVAPEATGSIVVAPTGSVGSQVLNPNSYGVGRYGSAQYQQEGA